MTDVEILRIWNMLEKQTNTEARVLSCAVSAYENNDSIVTRRAEAVLQVIWKQKKIKLGGVPSEIRGTTDVENNNRNRLADFNRLIQLIRSESDRRQNDGPEQSSVVQTNVIQPSSADGVTESGSVGIEPPVASDLDAPPAERVIATVSRIVRDTELAKRIKGFHYQFCQLCGETVQLSNGTGYAEGHHLQPLGKPHDGPDVAENIVCLCPNHHAALDFGAITLAATDLRTTSGHVVGQKFIDYHNRVVYRGARHTEPDAPSDIGD